MSHDQPEGIGADLARPDRFMAVDPGAPFPLGIVRMNQLQSTQANRRVEVRNRTIEFLGGRECIARGEDVAGVEAHCHTVHTGADAIDTLEHGGDLLEGVAEARALARRRLDQDPSLAAGRAIESGGDSGGGSLHGFRTRLFAGGSRVRHHPGNTQQLCPFEFRNQPVERFLSQDRIGGRRVDQVGIVHHHQREARCLDCPLEGLHSSWIDRGDIPAVDVAGEDLQAVAAGFDGTINGTALAARD